MIAIIDYDAGNLRSVEKALVHLGEEALVTRNFKELKAADRIILPGVGAYGEAMDKLRRYDLIGPVKEAVESGKPFLGICLGLQLLFEGSEENGGVEGLSLLEGKIVKIPEAPGLKIPHIGWNSLAIAPNKRLFQGIPKEAFVYFVHSYYLQAEREADVAASTEYGVFIHAAVERKMLFACQFHPEKSGETGLGILKNFASVRGPGMDAAERRRD